MLCEWCRERPATTEASTRDWCVHEVKRQVVIVNHIILKVCGECEKGIERQRNLGARFSGGSSRAKKPKKKDLATTQMQLAWQDSDAA